MQKRAIITGSIILLGLFLLSCGSSGSSGGGETTVLHETEVPKVQESVQTLPDNDKDTDIEDEPEVEEIIQDDRDEKKGTEEKAILILCRKYIDGMLIENTENKDYQLKKIIDEYEKEYLTADDSCMVEALLYKELKDNTYRKKAEAHLTKVAEDYSNGGNIDLARRKSIYYGIVTYLSTEEQVDYKLSEALMKLIFEKANSLLNINADADIDGDAELNAHMLLVANTVTFSPEYVRMARFYLDRSENGTDSEFILQELERAEAIINK